MDGYKFESQCATILKKKHFKKIEVTKSSCDQGIDIIAYKHGKNTAYSVNITLTPLVTKQFRRLMQGQIFMIVTK